MGPRYIIDYINSVLIENKKISDDELEKLVSCMVNQAKEKQEMLRVYEDFPETVMFTIYHILIRIPESTKRNECIDILCDFLINFKEHYYAAAWLMNPSEADYLLNLREFTWNDITGINISPVINDRNLNKIAEILFNSPDILSSTIVWGDNAIDNIDKFLNNILRIDIDNFKLKKEYYDKYMSLAIECLKTNKLVEKINKCYPLYSYNNSNTISKEDLDFQISKFQCTAVRIFCLLGKLQRAGLLEENKKLNERLDQASKCIIELGNGTLAYNFAEAVSSYSEQDTVNIIGKDNANKLADIILKAVNEGSLNFTELGNFITCYSIAKHLGSDVISKSIDIMIDLSKNNNSFSVICNILNFYLLLSRNKNVKQNDLSKINDHILKIGTLEEITIHVYYNGDKIDDIGMAKITNKIKNSKDAKVIYEYITCCDKKNDISYFNYNIKWTKKFTRLKDEDVLDLIKTLIEAENIEIPLLNDNDFQIIRKLIEDSNNYKEFSDELHKLYDKSSDKRNNEISYSDDSIDGKRNNHSKNKVLEFFRKIKNSKKS